MSVVQFITQGLLTILELSAILSVCFKCFYITPPHVSFETKHKGFLSNPSSLLCLLLLCVSVSETQYYVAVRVAILDQRGSVEATPS